MTNTGGDYTGPIPYVTFDTNCLNSKGLIPEMTQLQKWADEGLLFLPVSVALHDELPDGPGRMRDKASEFVIVGGKDLNADEAKLFGHLREVIFPQTSTLTPQQEKDLCHLFDHQKYQDSQWSFFVTNDRHFLDHADELLGLGLRVGTPHTCMEWIKPILANIRQEKASAVEDGSVDRAKRETRQIEDRCRTQEYTIPPYSITATALRTLDNTWAPKAVVKWLDGLDFHIQDIYAQGNPRFLTADEAIRVAASVARRWIDNSRNRT